ncbi:hypothetical protein JAAARDRAFT_197623 [Jaapia argillacea MUCL 33604]|uniref:Uncharacterized protein n=1 Tax=Jaapia argillacea MUCL 33604 TaxID=933084 RepID=A0A067PH19_9AGAM|nr:hypothetical protein JAAARDRAFT_197623 [Jaapia argillacea MUCL 33604]
MASFNLDGSSKPPIVVEMTRVKQYFSLGEPLTATVEEVQRAAKGQFYTVQYNPSSGNLYRSDRKLCIWDINKREFQVGSSATHPYHPDLPTYVNWEREQLRAFQPQEPEPVSITSPHSGTFSPPTESLASLSEVLPYRNPSFKAPEDTDSEKEEDQVDPQEDEPIEAEHPFTNPANPLNPVIFQPQPLLSPPTPTPNPPPLPPIIMTTPTPKGPKLAAPTPFTGDR